MSDSANEKDRMPRKVLNIFSISYVLNIACLADAQFSLLVLYFNWQPNPGIKMKEKKCLTLWSADQRADRHVEHNCRAAPCLCSCQRYRKGAVETDRS